MVGPFIAIQSILILYLAVRVVRMRRDYDRWLMEIEGRLRERGI